jgi:hypothetical protein
MHRTGRRRDEEGRGGRGVPGPPRGRGIDQRGWDIVAGAAAFGAGPRAVRRGRIEVGGGELGAGAERVSDLVDHLLAQIDEHAAELAEPERAWTAARALRDEVAGADRDRAVTLVRWPA